MHLDVGEDVSRGCPDEISFGTTIYQTTKKLATSVVRLSWTCSPPEATMKISSDLQNYPFYPFTITLSRIIKII